MRLPIPPQTNNPDLDRWNGYIRGQLEFEGPVEAIHGWIADDVQTVVVGKLPAHSYVMSVRIHVTEAFNSGGTDTVTVGWDADVDALFTSVDVSTTGLKGEAMGAIGALMGVNDGYNSAEQTVKAYYSNGGTEPTTGKALVIVEFLRVTKQIS